MTRPRIVDPGATLALSRRTTRRHFLLHPDQARQMEQVYNNPTLVGVRCRT
jgi:hypothetical protein